MGLWLTLMTLLSGKYFKEAREKQKDQLADHCNNPKGGHVGSDQDGSSVSRKRIELIEVFLKT